MSVTYGYVKCPVCGTKYWIPFPADGVWCDCYKICEDGDGDWYPSSGCSWSEYNYRGQLDAYEHQDTAVESKFADKLHITGYCSTHNKYIHKQPIYVEMDWDEWLRNPPSDASRTEKAKINYR